jgi:uncharacterized protein YqeY
MLHEQIKAGIKEAMLAKNELLLKATRNMVAALTAEVMAKGKKPNEFLTDEESLAVLAKLAKQRKDSMEQFKKRGERGFSKRRGS